MNIKEITSEEAIKSRNNSWKLLIDSVNTSTEELYEAKKREINLLKILLEKDKVITGLIKGVADKQFPKEAD